MKLEFKADDFRIKYIMDGVTPSKVFEAYAQQAAEDANARLAEMLDMAPVVYRNSRITAPKVRAVYWTEYENDLTLDGPVTERARLVEIEELLK